MNQMVTSQVFERTVASVQAPLQHFIETGFWNPYTLEGWKQEDISDSVVRASCRVMSRELKRPFIRAHPVISHNEYVDGRWRGREGPAFEYGYVEVPRRKYLVPLIAPLTLATNARDIRDLSGETLWQFKIYSRQIWDEYYQYLLIDPDCRRARKLPPLTQ